MTKVITIFLILLSSVQLFAQLKNEKNQADYIIITVPEFRECMEFLRDYRSERGLNVKLVDINEITEGFEDSSLSGSIRMFIGYALSYWQDPKPQYLLLAGDVEFIPSIVVESGLHVDQIQEDSVSMDALYSINIYQNDMIPDIAVGRIPVNNLEEINLIMEKIIRFENNAEQATPSSVILVDRQDGSAFQSLANRLEQSFAEKNIRTEMISAFNDTGIIKVKQKIIQKINDMPLYVSYYGHGNPYIWSSDTLFNYESISELNNFEIPFIYTGASCNFNFDSETDSTISEGLLFSQSGGAVACIGSSGLNLLTTGDSFIKGFWGNVLMKADTKIGDAFLAEQKENFGTYSRRFTLLGDPALNIPAYIIADINTETIPDRFVLRQNYPNPFNPTTVIEYQIPEDSNVSLDIFDILGNRIKNVEQGYKHAGSYSIEIDLSNHASGIYLYQLKTKFGAEVRKMSYLK